MKRGGGKLRENGVPKDVTVQRMCKVCRDEKDVRSVLDAIWKEPLKVQEVLSENLDKNQKVFEFEKALAVNG